MYNAYFEEMTETLAKYIEEREAYNKRLEALIEENNALVRADKFDKETATAKFEALNKPDAPYTDGEIAALRAYEYAKENNQSMCIVRDYIWPGEIDDFAEAMRVSGEEFFILAEESTGLMRELHSFWSLNITFHCLEVLEIRGFMQKEFIRGIMMKIN